MILVHFQGKPFAITVIQVCAPATDAKEAEAKQFYEDLQDLLEKVKVKVKSLSHVQLFGTPWTVAYQAFPSMGFSRQEYWSGLPFPLPGDLPDPEIKPGSPHCRQIFYCLSHKGSHKECMHMSYLIIIVTFTLNNTIKHTELCLCCYIYIHILYA